MKKPLLGRIGDAFNALLGRNYPNVVQAGGYAQVLAIGGQNDDWPLTFLTEDADVWQNSWALTSRVRDLFRCNPLYQAYRETLWANVFGSEGIMLRSQVFENEDRIVRSIDEERAIKAYEERRNRVGEFFATQRGDDWKREMFLHATGQNGSRIATVKSGQPDIQARLLIEAGWKEWGRRENCDARKSRNYQTIRQLRLISAVRDGDFFIRMIRDPRKNRDGSFALNKFGFSLQLINSEWCDRWYNDTLPNGNVVRMGIEYTMNSWGIGEPVAYYFIKRQPRDWQWSVQGGFGYGGQLSRDRILASEIIHYARVVDAGSTRPAPWVASTIPSSRQLNQAMIAEVIAWRASACKMGYLESDIVPEGGFMGEPPDPTQIDGRSIRVTAGGVVPLPYGVKYNHVDPKHPNANVEEFRKAMLRDSTAGMPGANYSTMANDYEAINFSAGRLQRLDTNETNKVLQVFDIDYAEQPIFENWLFMALSTGGVPLPLAKFDKFNRKVFQGRRWGQVDEMKEVTAAALRVANGFSSDQRECADRGLDLEEILFEQAESNMLKEQLGLPVQKTVENPTMDKETEDDEDETKPDKKEHETNRVSLS